MSSKRSAVWNFFKVNVSDNTHVLCSTCGESVSRGGKDSRSFNTSNLTSHLRRQHPDQLRQVEEESKRKRPGTPSTPTATPPKAPTVQTSVVSAFSRNRPWEFNDPRSLRVHRRVAEMIAVDDQAFSVVENEGFRRVIDALEPRYTLPSEKYFRETAIPDMYKAVRVKLLAVFDSVKHVSFTTDTWTTSQCSESMISLTAHWISDGWERKSAILQVQHLTGSHTAVNIAGAMSGMLTDWKLDDKVHVVVRDNAANMAKAMTVAGIQSIGCFAHTLQLAVKTGLESQAAVNNAIAVCRKIAGHFSHSCLAKEKLTAIQQSKPGHPQHSILQDVVTRWNSTFYMLERLVEQKKALLEYSADNSDIPDLKKDQWALIEKVVGLLRPMEQVTREVIFYIFHSFISLKRNSTV
jgi:hypothetical protein